MSRIRISPPVATVYPGDRQLFTAQATPPPAMWKDVSDSGDIKSDFSLEVDGAGSQTSANAGHRLHSGIGTVEFTIDDQCRPTSSGFFQFAGFVHEQTGFDYSYFVVISATTLEVKDEGAITIFSQPYTPTSGDVFRLELVAGFRLYRNGALLHQRLNLPTLVVFPHFYSVFIGEPTASAPTRVPQPRLIGDWRLAPQVTWTTPAHGTLTPISGSTQAEYSGGTTPGTYAVTGAIEPAADAGGVQKGTATVIIPPLQILGPTEVTLDPGQSVRFKTNYDAAQTLDLLSWAVISGGGSFSQGEFTAPTAPGTTLVRATCAINKQVANITVTVPALITTPISAAAPGDIVEFATNLADPPTWTASDGLINNAGIWRAPQGTDRTVRITATAGSNTATRDMLIVPKFPYSDFSLPVTWDRNRDVLIAMSADRKNRITRDKAPPYDSYPIKLTSRSLTESNAVDGFFDQQGFGKPFILEDKARGLRKVGWFDSKIAHEARDECDIDLAFQFLEARL
jgi:hypothetical protein